MSSTAAKYAPEWLQAGTQTWWVVYLFGPVILLGVGLALVPRLVYDQYIWQYLWGPVVADAAGHPVTYHGVTAVKGYNPVNTATYLAIVMYALPGIREFFNTFDIGVNTPLAYGLAPLVVAGGVMRALQDTGLLPPPFDRLFLTPLIYFIVAGVTIVVLLVAVGLRERYDVAVTATVGGVGTGWTIGGFGAALTSGLGQGGLFRLLVPLVVLAAATLITLGFSVAGGRLGWPAIQHPILLLVVFAQMVDATQILLGVTFYDYAPKLLITRAVYGAIGVPGSAFALKLGATLLIVWVLADSRGELSYVWWWLIAFVAMAVGLAPGVHGIVRMMLGV